MLETETTTAAILRTEQGLTLAEMWITTCDISSYLKADWPSHLIQLVEIGLALTIIEGRAV
jgi:hypothetical protein